jgi:methyl-accepting chemotaxis protein
VLTTKRRIELIGVIAIFGALLAAFIQYSGSQQVSAQQGRLEQANTLTTLVASIDNQMLEARRVEKDFVIRKDTELLARHVSVVQGVEKAIGTLSEEIGSSEAVKELVEDKAKLLESVGRYAKAFKWMAQTEQELGLNQDEGLRGSFRKGADALEKEIMLTKSDVLLAEMLQMRRQEKNFLIRARSEDAAAFEASLQRFQTKLRMATIDDDKRIDISTLINDYSTDVKVYIQRYARFSQELKAVSDTYAVVNKQLESVETKVKAIVADQRLQVSTAVETSQKMSLLFTAIVLVAVTLATFLVARSVIKPLSSLQGAMQQLAAGDLHTKISQVNRNDEIGTMANAVDQFRKGLVETEALRSQHNKRAASEGAERRDLLGHVAADFESKVGEIIASVSSAVGQVNMAASNLSITMEETSAQAQSVAQASEEASLGTAAVAVATQQVSMSIESVAQNIERSTLIASKAVSDAERMTGSMRQLSESMVNVTAIIDLIGNVAGQTNLLALNATIESARAGEHGRGFAVVASEVKNLAAKTAQATDEITKRIADMRHLIVDASDAAGNIGGTIDEMQVLADSIATAMTEQSVAARSIAENTNKASQNADAARDGVEQMVRTAMETSASGQQLSDTSAAMQRETDLLRMEVSGFLTTLRAA